MARLVYFLRHFMPDGTIIQPMPLIEHAVLHRSWVTSIKNLADAVEQAVKIFLTGRKSAGGQRKRDITSFYFANLKALRLAHDAGALPVVNVTDLATSEAYRSPIGNTEEMEAQDTSDSASDTVPVTSTGSSLDARTKKKKAKPTTGTTQTAADDLMLATVVVGESGGSLTNDSSNHSRKKSATGTVATKKTNVTKKKGTADTAAGTAPPSVCSAEHSNRNRQSTEISPIATPAFSGLPVTSTGSSLDARTKKRKAKPITDTTQTAADDLMLATVVVGESGGSLTNDSSNYSRKKSAKLTHTLATSTVTVATKKTNVTKKDADVSSPNNSSSNKLSTAMLLVATPATASSSELQPTSHFGNDQQSGATGEVSRKKKKNKTDTTGTTSTTKRDTDVSSANNSSSNKLSTAMLLVATPAKASSSELQPTSINDNTPANTPAVDGGLLKTFWSYLG
jgi:hypothetical protein